MKHFKLAIVAAALLITTGCNKGNSVIDQAEAAVRQKLIDPVSATFQNLRVIADGAYICGEVNSKNRMGGYAGFKHFMYQAEAGEAHIAKSTNGAALVIASCALDEGPEELKEAFDLIQY